MIDRSEKCYTIALEAGKVEYKPKPLMASRGGGGRETNPQLPEDYTTLRTLWINPVRFALHL